MHERFTSHARMAMAMASVHACRLRHDLVDTGHILLALIDEESGLAQNCLAAAALRELGADPARLRVSIERLLPPGAGTSGMSGIARGPGARQAIDAAFDEALTLDREYIGTEHLLLGILRQEGGVAARALAEYGLALSEVREWVLRRIGQGGE